MCLCVRSMAGQSSTALQQDRVLVSVLEDFPSICTGCLRPLCSHTDCLHAPLLHTNTLHLLDPHTDASNAFRPPTLTSLHARPIAPSGSGPPAGSQHSRTENWQLTFFHSTPALTAPLSPAPCHLPAHLHHHPRKSCNPQRIRIQASVLSLLGEGKGQVGYQYERSTVWPGGRTCHSTYDRQKGFMEVLTTATKPGPLASGARQAEKTVHADAGCQSGACMSVRQLYSTAVHTRQKEVASWLSTLT